jgi:hypothetical protein
MRVLRSALSLALFFVVLVPELRSYRVERELRRLTAIAIAAASGRAPSAMARALLLDTSRRLEALARVMPGDVRPRMNAGSAAFVAGDDRRALDLYLDAHQCGERGEIDLNLGRVFDRLEDSRAESMFVRAIWLSPTLFDSVPETFRGRVRHTIALGISSGGEVTPPPLAALPIRIESIE